MKASKAERPYAPLVNIRHYGSNVHYSGKGIKSK